MAIKQFFSVSEVAREKGVAPRIISDLFYCRQLDDERCPIVGGKRLVPVDYIHEIETVLRDAGHLPVKTTKTKTAVAV